MTTKASIERFLKPRTFAISGVSRNPKKFGGSVYFELKKKGFKLYPINPNTDKINGDPCYRSVSDLPAGVDRLLVLTKKEQTEAVIREALDKGIKKIWIQQMSDTPEALQLANSGDAELIHKQCIMKFAEPVTGVHKFHRFLNKIFSGLPK